eukprot:3427167-Amphidinium_carterae.1
MPMRESKNKTSCLLFDTFCARIEVTACLWSSFAQHDCSFAAGSPCHARLSMSCMLALPLHCTQLENEAPNHETQSLEH